SSLASTPPPSAAPLPLTEALLRLVWPPVALTPPPCWAALLLLTVLLLMVALAPAKAAPPPSWAAWLLRMSDWSMEKVAGPAGLLGEKRPPPSWPAVLFWTLERLTVVLPAGSTRPPPSLLAWLLPRVES